MIEEKILKTEQIIYKRKTWKYKKKNQNKRLKDKLRDIEDQ